MSDHCDSVPTIVEETVVAPAEVEEAAPAPAVEEVTPVVEVEEAAPAVEAAPVVEEVAPSS
jgi:hypothetical protein